MDNQQGPTEQHRELYSVLCGSLDDGRGVWGRMDTESLQCSSEIITTLLIRYTPIQKKKKNQNLK